MKKQGAPNGPEKRAFATRLTTAVIFAIVMFAGILGGVVPFFGLFSMIAVLAAWEFFNLLLDPLRWGERLVGLLMVLLPMGWVIVESLKPGGLFPFVHGFDFFLLLTLIILFLTLYELFSVFEKPFRNLSILLLGMVYIGFSLSLVPVIAFLDGTFSPFLILGLLLLTWSNDTFAYLVGSRIGRRPLFARVSPKKTWEGTVGGGILTLSLAGCFGYFWPGMGIGVWLGLGVIVAVFGTLGDLVESRLKRASGKKDSGYLLPGHGGVLDRFDAFLFLVPFAVTYLYLLHFGW